MLSTLLQSPVMCTWREKLTLTVPLAAAVLLLYFGALHSTLFSAIPMPDTAVDRAIPFIPIFVVPYFSYYLLLFAPVFAIRESQAFRDAAFGFALIVVVSCTAFLFWPTAITTSYSHPLIRGLLAVDRPRNACPSLHASLSLFCTLSAVRSIRNAGARFGLGVWTFLVIAATLFTKRHSVVDIAAGILFGWIVYWLMNKPSVSQSHNSYTAKPGEASTDAISTTPARLRVLALPVVLLAISVSISSWAITHPSITLLAFGIAVSAISFILLLRSPHKATHTKLLSNPLANWTATSLLGFSMLTSFTACQVIHGGSLRPPDSPYISRLARILSTIRLTAGLLLSVILMPIPALRFGSANQRKLICTEYALLFLVCSILFRAFSARTLLLVWILPVVLAGLFAAVQAAVRLGLKNSAGSQPTTTAC